MRFIFFGDSICFGQFVSPHKTWIVKLSEKFETVYGKDFVVMNPSVNGNTTRDALNRIHYDVLSHKPEFVYIQYGLNDCNIWEQDNGICRVPQYSFRSNLYELIERCEQAGTKSIFLGANHVTKKNDIYDNLNIEFNNIIAQNMIKYIWI